MARALWVDFDDDETKNSITQPKISDGRPKNSLEPQKFLGYTKKAAHIRKISTWVKKKNSDFSQKSQNGQKSVQRVQIFFANIPEAPR